MTLAEAIDQATQRARLLDEPYVVLGPCPQDGYWSATLAIWGLLWKDRIPYALVSPGGQLETYR